MIVYEYSNLPRIIIFDSWALLSVIDFCETVALYGKFDCDVLAHFVVSRKLITLLTYGCISVILHRDSFIV